MSLNRQTKKHDACPIGELHFVQRNGWLQTQTVTVQWHFAKVLYVWYILVSQWGVVRDPQYLDFGRLYSVCYIRV